MSSINDDFVDPIDLVIDFTRVIFFRFTLVFSCRAFLATCRRLFARLLLIFLGRLFFGERRDFEDSLNIFFNCLIRLFKFINFI